MAVWPFSRKKTSQVDEQVPEEVREYYESGKKRTAMAWLLAFATLVVTVLLALFIFLAGRWVYQQFTSEDEPQAPTTQPTETKQPAEETPKTTTTTPNTQQGTSSSSTQAPVATPAASSPTTGPTATEVPNTGPGPEGLQ